MLEWFISGWDGLLNVSGRGKTRLTDTGLLEAPELSVCLG